MKKLMVLLSLLVIALFVVSCAPKEEVNEEGTEESTALAGEAVKLSKADLTGPTCKVIDILQADGEKFKGVTAAEACKQISRTCISLVTYYGQYIEEGQKLVLTTAISGNYYCDSAILGEMKTDQNVKPIGYLSSEVKQVFCCR